MWARSVPTLVRGEDIERLRRIGPTGECMVRLPGSAREQNRMLYRVSHVHTSATFRSFEDTLQNVETALLERVFYVRDPADTSAGNASPVFMRPPQPMWNAFNTLLAPFKRQLRYRAVTIAPVDLSVYPETYYSGRRLAVYQRARDNVIRRGVRHSDSYVSTFLKHEKVIDGVKRVVPRVIQPRKPEYNVVLGSYVRPLEHVLYDDIAELFGAPTVMKGYNAFEIGEMFHRAWESFDDVAGVGLDASRFDQHVSRDALAWEHGCYKLYNPDPELQKLLSWQLRTVGYASTPSGRVKYIVNGCRCSGDMNTALGNCLLMCAMVYGLCSNLGLMARGKPRVRLFNNGDDCFIIGERADVVLFTQNVPKWFTSLGFEMKVEQIVDVLERACFCQANPVFDGVGWRMCRDPRVTLSKDGYIVRREQALPHNAGKLMNAVGQCGISLTGGLPLLQSYYLCLLRGTKSGKLVSEELYNSGFYRLSHGAKGTTGVITTAARVSFYNAFDIVPDLQIALERYYDGLTLHYHRIVTEESQTSVGVMV